MKNSSKAKTLVLDANVWIYGLLGTSRDAMDLISRCLKGECKVVVNSYVVAEVTRVLKRVAIEIRRDPLELERSFWRILNSDNVVKDFIHPITDDLINMMRRRPEILMIAQILEIEPKDVPYLILAFKCDVPVVTTDERSLARKRKRIKELIGVEVLTLKEIVW
ncbi:MAG: PIN domain-containing protein [Candidatus Baldrarchaeia archaeon]